MCRPLPISLLLLLLLGTTAFAQQTSYRFEDPLFSGPAFPVYPGAEADLGYAGLARYILAFMHGVDERSIQAWTWHTPDGLDQVKAFFGDAFGYSLRCETEDHQNFMKKYWSLFLDLQLPNTEGTYVHCASGNLDLFSPVYNYALQEWQTGTMILFRR